MFRLIEVKALPEYRLWLRYEDGVEGEVDCAHLVGRGVLETLSDPDVFENVYISPNGALSWDEDIELCPDALYMQITGKTAEQVFPKLRSTTIDS